MSEQNAVHPASPDTYIKYGIQVSVSLSVCPTVDRILSALYLQQYSPDPFHIYTSYQVTGGVVHVNFFLKLKNLKFWQIL